MYTAQGKFCFLEELTTGNDKELFELIKKNKDEYRFLISDEPVPEVRKTPLIGEALGLILNFALEILKVEKVEFSVYKENEEMLRILGKEKIKRYIKEKGESKSTVNLERTIINFEINLESLKEIDERLKRFYKPR